jgi:segregation and condensation protein B
MNDFVDGRPLIESLLFVSDEVLSVAAIAQVSELSQTEVRQILVELAAAYESEPRGFVLREVAGGWRLFSHPAYSGYIERLVLSWDTRRLSQAALEALAIVAYKQPVTRSMVNAIRGVNSEGALSGLVDKGLVKEVGREKSPGQPILHGTTDRFLERFGLRSLEDLPPLEEFAPDEETKRQIAETLSGGMSRFAGLDQATGAGEEARAAEGEATGAGDAVPETAEAGAGAGDEDEPMDIEAVD